MKLFFVVLSLFLSSTIHAQIENLPNFEDIEGISRTIVEKKMYSLLSKVNISEGKNAEDFKNLISNLNYFEVYDSKKEDSGRILLDKITEFIDSNDYQNLEENIFEKINNDQKEFIIVKKGADLIETITIFVFTTLKSFETDNLKAL